MHIPPTNHSYPNLYEELVKSDKKESMTHELLSIFARMSYDIVNARKPSFSSDDEKEDCRKKIMKEAIKWWWKYDVSKYKPTNKATSPKTYFIQIMKNSFATWLINKNNNINGTSKN